MLLDSRDESFSDKHLVRLLNDPEDAEIGKPVLMKDMPLNKENRPRLEIHVPPDLGLSKIQGVSHRRHIVEPVFSLRTLDRQKFSIGLEQVAHRIQCTLADSDVLNSDTREVVGASHAPYQL